MINWRDGKAGFVGASKRIIKGFFEYSHTITSAVTVPTVPGIEYTSPDNRLHYIAKDNKLHYESPINRLHYTAPEED